MKKYIFTWGQKQSIMNVGASFLITGLEGSLLNSNIRETLCIVTKGGVYEHYFTDKSIDDWRKNGSKYSNKKFTKKLLKDMDLFVKSFFKLSNNVKRKDLTKLSNKELKKKLIKNKFFVQQGLLYFGASTPSATYIIEEKIKKILNKHLKDKKLAEDYFISLSTPSKLDETMKERLYFFKILKKKKIKDKDLEDYARKFPALFMNTYDKKEVKRFLRSKIKNRPSENEIKKEIINIKSNLRKISNKHKKIYSEIKSKELKYYSSILQQSALMRYRLKHVWNGVEYNFLDSLYEVQKRIGIGFDDFIRSYLFEDIFNFLDNNVKLTKKQISERKKCMVFHYYNGKVHRYAGQKALDYKNKLISNKKISKSELIKGMVANKGYVKSKVKIIDVGDLDQFIKNSNNFKKGEILVTTMTSPVMVPLMKKASAVITDEGGICSHAAVISREFNIPCIIGAKVATKLLKNGDLVEVDAIKGVIRKIK